MDGRICSKTDPTGSGVICYEMDRIGETVSGYRLLIWPNHAPTGHRYISPIWTCPFIVALGPVRTESRSFALLTAGG